MPLHEYKRPDGSTFERIFRVGETVPMELDGGVRMAPRCSFKFKGAFSGGTAERDILSEVGPDSTVVDDSVKREVKEKQRLKKKRETEKRRAVIQETLATA